MGWWIVRQPNGRLARFSDSVNNFTHMNLTEAEAVDICRKYLNVNDAFYKVELGMGDKGLKRWADALSRIRDIHGDAQRMHAEQYDHFGHET
jgi:hypothetical protein